MVASPICCQPGGHIQSGKRSHKRLCLRYSSRPVLLSGHTMYNLQAHHTYIMRRASCSSVCVKQHVELLSMAYGAWRFASTAPALHAPNTLASMRKYYRKFTAAYRSLGEVSLLSTAV